MFVGDVRLLTSDSWHGSNGSCEQTSVHYEIISAYSAHISLSEVLPLDEALLNWIAVRSLIFQLYTVLGVYCSCPSVLMFDWVYKFVVLRASDQDTEVTKVVVPGRELCGLHANF